jgi:hypothetical protein
MLSSRGIDDAIEAMQGSARLLITGIGRSGTQYMAELLTACGLPCGHEALFPTSCKGLPEWGKVAAESAWPAAPWLGEMRRREAAGEHDRVVVVHLVRNPLAWIASWSQTVWSEPGATRSTRYLCKHTGVDWPRVIDEQGALAASAQLWVHYNRLVDPFADVRLRVEDVGVTELATLFGMLGRRLPETETLQAALDEVPHNVNARRHGTVFWDDVREQTYFRNLAHTYGYTPPRLNGGAGI